ncbi:hypothetical protein niasHT_030571 [Heterodera trifolii]|uniref:DUF4371 domain-containing protein n=1 Tax=Heterodera trifolii TaxID=157864 RepID=A0ABD2ITV6_9BILA
MAPLHPIWKIGLFEKSKENDKLAECVECKAQKQGKYQFKLSDAAFSRRNYENVIHFHVRQTFGLSLTIEGVTNKWERVRHILAIKPFPGTHTGRRIAEILSEIIDQWACQDKIHAFATDGGTNMKKVELNEAQIEEGLPQHKALLSQIRQMDLRVHCGDGNLQGITEVEEMRSKLLDGLEERFCHLENEKLHALSTFLDPRCKHFLQRNVTISN